MGRWGLERWSLELRTQIGQQGLLLPKEETFITTPRQEMHEKKTAAVLAEGSERK